MLLARRKRQQQLTGKIGHEGERYELGGPNNLNAPYAAQVLHPPRPLPHDANPALLQPKQQQQQQLLIPQEVPRNVFSTDLVPLPSNNINNNNNNYNINGGFQMPISFPSALPPLQAMPILPNYPEVKSSPMRFPSAFDAVVATPAWAPSLPSEQPVLMRHVPPPQLPPLMFNQTPPPPPPLPSASTPRIRDGNNGNQPVRGSSGGISPYPQGCSDPKRARSEARRRALELQNENARLCEERRLRRQRERQAEIAEDVRQGANLHWHREDIPRKKRQQRPSEGEGRPVMEAKEPKRYGEPDSMAGGRPHEDLFKPIEKPSLEEAVTRSRAGSAGVTGVMHKRPLDESSVSVIPSLLDAAADIPGAQVSPPMFAPIEPRMDAVAPYIWPSATPVGPGVEVVWRPPEEGGAVVTGEAPRWCPPPCLSNTVEHSLAAQKEHLESQLQDMVVGHSNIQRMLEDDLEPKPSFLPPPPPPPGIAKKPQDVSGGIKVLGVNLHDPPYRPSTVLCQLEIPKAFSDNCDELSAEPSKFVGAVRYTA